MLNVISNGISVSIILIFFVCEVTLFASSVDVATMFPLLVNINFSFLLLALYHVSTANSVPSSFVALPLIILYSLTYSSFG